MSPIERKIWSVSKRVRKVFKASAGQLFERNGPREIAEARFAFRAILREETKLPITKLGPLLCCDHTSISDATNRVKELCAVDPEYASKVQRLRQMTNPNTRGKGE